MNVAETAVLYSLLGIAVAAALRLDAASRSLWTTPLHVVLWPFFAGLLFRTSSAAETERLPGAHPSAGGERHPEVREAERKLVEALERLEGPAEDALGTGRERIRRLVDSLDAMYARRNRMDELLASETFDAERVRDAVEEADGDEARDARLESARNRLEHIRRLQQMRTELDADLEAALGKIDEIATQISLLQFADHPQPEVSDLIEDIAATVEGVSQGMLDPGPLLESTRG